MYILKFFLFLCLWSITLHAACTNNEQQIAREYYLSSDTETEMPHKIKLLQKALNTCYAPEIEANLFLLEASRVQNRDKQIYWYKKSLLSISQFKNKADVIKYQNMVNAELSILYKIKNPSLSTLYAQKQREEIEKSDIKDYIWVFGMFFLLFLWGIYKNLK